MSHNTRYEKFVLSELASASSFGNKAGGEDGTESDSRPSYLTPSSHRVGGRRAFGARGTNTSSLPIHSLPIVDEAPALLTRSNVLHLARVTPKSVERVTDPSQFAFEVEEVGQMASVVDGTLVLGVCFLLVAAYGLGQWFWG